MPSAIGTSHGMESIGGNRMGFFVCPDLFTTHKGNPRFLFLSLHGCSSDIYLFVSHRNMMISTMVSMG